MEKIYADNILNILSPSFYIEKEVKGTHFSGERLRIDAVLKPKESFLWKNPNISLGIEFKSVENLKSTKNITHWVTQCIDYANTNWDKHGYIYIFSCPSIFDKLSYTVQDKEWLWNRILSNLGIGRLVQHHIYGWTFYLQDSHRIWSQKDGIIAGKTWSLNRKLGRTHFTQSIE